MVEQIPGGVHLSTAAYTRLLERLAQAEAHVVHVTAEPIAEDVVWCEACEEWVTAGPPEAALPGDAAPRTDGDTR